MCGRFAITATPSMIASHFNLAESFELSPNYNVTPSMQVPVVRSVDGKRSLCLLRWGLIPHWAKDEKIGYKLINARAETVFEKPAFRGAAMERRCLIVASGFFEWQKTGSFLKQPYFLTLRDQALFAFAGLWESWSNIDHGSVDSCTILTTAANRLMQPIHDRMPVIIGPEHYARWLLADADPEGLKELFRPFPAEAMTAYPVSRAVNNPRHNRPDCIAPLAEG